MLPSPPMTDLTPRDDELLLAYAQSRGMTVSEVRDQLSALGESAAVDGLLHCVLSAKMLREGARLDMMAAERAMYVTDYSGNPVHGKTHPTFNDFESAEGKERRAWARQMRNDARLALKEARQHYAQAAFFRTTLGADPLKLVKAQVEDEEPEETDDQKTARRMAARVLEIASRNEQAVTTRQYRSAKREGKAGLAEVAEDEAELAAIGEEEEAA